MPSTIFGVGQGERRGFTAKPKPRGVFVEPLFPTHTYEPEREEGAHAGCINLLTFLICMLGATSALSSAFEQKQLLHAKHAELQNAQNFVPVDTQQLHRNLQTLTEAKKRLTSTAAALKRNVTQILKQVQGQCPQAGLKWRQAHPYSYQRYFRLRLPLSGVFVDVGAGDGVFQSETLFYEKHLCWGGLVIEPAPNEFLKLQENRQGSIALNFPISNTDGEKDFTDVTTSRGMWTGWSGFRSPAPPHPCVGVSGVVCMDSSP
ncbi:hypothetical protein CYMTET_22034 [Cymbomonas tetramitiformis]|uniref:Methyltransferase FkbM domain-containing protein n=1 Tax=Cymbomonas tetramitiformis TaxID=36881 RepID=A0AAE0G112_9CHLO|nr:hypothetical protein CYMTET_22034 [Cymbomonas tetramitiformis]